MYANSFIWFVAYDVHYMQPTKLCQNLELLTIPDLLYIVEAISKYSNILNTAKLQKPRLKLRKCGSVSLMTLN